MDQNDITFFKRVTRATPFQFLGEPAVEDDRSQLLRLLMPFLTLVKIEIDFWIHIIHKSSFIKSNIYFRPTAERRSFYPPVCNTRIKSSTATTTPKGLSRLRGSPKRYAIPPPPT